MSHIHTNTINLLNIGYTKWREPRLLRDMKKNEGSGEPKSVQQFNQYEYSEFNVLSV
jgi:hypothetical protein